MSGWTKGGALLLGFVALGACFLASVVYGATPIGWGDAWRAITAYDETSMEQVIARTARMPRALIATAIGASLGVAGAVMQAVTRNPLASPTVLGINAGAACFVVAAVTLLGVSDKTTLLGASFAGAAAGAALAYALGSLGRDGLSPTKMILSGAAVTAAFGALTQGMLVHNEAGLQDVLFWLTGSVAGRSADAFFIALPFLAAGWAVSLLLAGRLNVLVMGDDTAKGLGQRTVYVKAAAGLVVVALAGGAVAVAGPIGFVGIVVPHLARSIAGPDHRWLLPLCAVMGACLLLTADIAARFLIMPEEVPVGVMTAAIGTPFFIYIARKGGERE
ncbi:iron ABC transporter permease [Paenibacillus sp. TRM 82003]|nr:iron ABC transporter permease [Paenibacillus sp. TRM 82003]